MQQYLDRLDTYLTEHKDKVVFGKALSVKELGRYEEENKIILSECLKILYQWKNGFQVGDEFRFFSLEESLQFYKDDLLYDRMQRDGEVWLPIFARHRATTHYYAIYLSEIDKDNNNNWLEVTNNPYERPYYFKFGRRDSVGDFIDFYSEVPVVLARFLDELAPQKQSFWKNLKGLFNLMGQALFER